MNRSRLQRPALRPARRRRAPDYADAVVASYINEISTRTRRPRGATASPWRATHPLE